ncbi:putative phage associated protein [Neisseria canis]|uniref:Putative phage associated protein n=2 Tax=Neisseria canis TaxID=493 RepID=A0A3S4Q9K9_9NEIS|nr:putative phage associated protein [Neisseria canis]
MLPHTGLFLLWKVALQIRIRRALLSGGEFTREMLYSIILVLLLLGWGK